MKRKKKFTIREESGVIKFESTEEKKSRNTLHAQFRHNATGVGAHKNKKAYDRNKSKNPKNW